MTEAEKLIKIAENEQLIANANSELEEALCSNSEGGKSWYDRFWDGFQQNGERTAYASAFGTGWNAENFKPKYVIKPSGQHGQYLFHFFNYNNPMMDFRDFKDKCDFSGTTTAIYMFENARVDYLELDFSHIINVGFCFAEGFSPGHKTHITLKISAATTTGLTTAFNYCNKLTDLIFENGSVIAIGINTQYCPLTKASIESVFAALSPTVTGQTATFKKTAKEAAFTDEEWATLIATKPNWTISLV